MTGTNEMILQTPAPSDQAGWSKDRGVMTMNSTKTFMLAAVTALTLGVGTAMAQSEVPSAAQATYFSGRHQAVPRMINGGAGASDLDWQHVGPAHFDYTTLANPG
jgi:hypothetical protein